MNKTQINSTATVKPSTPLLFQIEEVSNNLKALDILQAFYINQKVDSEEEFQKLLCRTVYCQRDKFLEQYTKRMYKVLNKEYFNNRFIKSTEYAENKTWLRSDVYSFCELVAPAIENTLLHEMVHVYCLFNNIIYIDKDTTLHTENYANVAREHGLYCGEDLKQLGSFGNYDPNFEDVYMLTCPKVFLNWCDLL